MEKKLNHQDNDQNISSSKEIITQGKKELEVILIYPSDMNEEGVPSALKVIGQKLQELGIKHKVYEETNQELELLLNQYSDSFKVFGWTACFQHVPMIIQWNRSLNQDFRQNSFSVIGGQMSSDEATCSYALESGIDAVNI
jgi:hypothetical protein